jgi:predicted dehydrogenase
LRIGILGAGNIVPFHLEALRATGFEFQFIGAKENSLNAERIAQEFRINHVLRSARDFIGHLKEVECLLIATSAKSLFEYLDHVKNIEIPTLIEKPIFMHRSELDHFDGDNILNRKILVGYNRRHYDSIIELKTEIESVKSGHLNIVVPELSTDASAQKPFLTDTILSNTVHVLDLLLFLTGLSVPEIQIEYISTPSDLPRFVLSANKGLLTIRMEIYFFIPDNYRITFRTKGKLIELRPFEIFRKYEGQQIIEPSEHNPIRLYNPYQVKEVVSSTEYSGKKNYKPGFIKQAQEFKNLVNNGQPVDSCSLQEAVEVSRLAFRLLDLM